ncbi:hypothetical protein KVR01_009105 [Diaporthe batatas]|uniref:uncharacterized protein n=1 Tax=Diaporthe batatas TaxID=748121 RepID=UPI001D03CCF4|nr:uncharacterized protein KVR01_009105 [Diaporthe batatas]KAG8160841.1 hypothetical protein KVR01_009105 [Diaporthe batatas]
MEVVGDAPGASSSPNNSNATHTALDPLLPEIRVLELLPAANFDAPLECRLVHRPLYGNSHEYEALSYVWGEPRFTAEITLNNEQYFITPNLDLALRHLRRPSAERTLWVDALCIHQSDLVERSQQVLLMKDIYSHCTVDLAWLPTSAEPSRFSWEVGKIHQAFELMKRISFKDAETLAEMHDGPHGHSNKRAESGAFLLGVEEQMALTVAFGGAGIWSRIWTMQELACAPQVRLVAGPHELDWAVVAAFLGDRPYADAFHAAFGHRGSGRALDLFFSGVVRVYDQRLAFADGNYRSNLLDTLARFQRNGASDPRDCVYGLLGLVTGQHGIVVDYTISTKQLFMDTVTSVIHASQDLDILCQTALMTRYRSENPHGLPSWVPDFSSSFYPDAHRAILFAQRGIYAAGRAHLNAPCHVIDNHFLPLKVVVLGCLQGDETVQTTRHIRGFTSVGDFRTWQVDKASQKDSLTWQVFGAPLTWLKTSGLGTCMLSGETRYMKTGETAMRAYWRTLVMDCGGYPITRLTDAEILENDLAFNNVLDFLVDKDKVECATSKQTHERSIAAKRPDEHLPMGGGNKMATETLLRLWESMPEKVSTMWCRNYQFWTFSVTDNGLYTMVRDSIAGDIIVSAEGAKVPLVLRERESHAGCRTYCLVGTAYVHGYMDGEALDMMRKGALREEEILLR